MSIKYKNRKGKTYFLHKGETKKGRVRYFFSLKKEGELVQEIPEGYEIHENPNALVFLRKIQPKIINDEEIYLIEKELKKQKKQDYKIDAKKNIITVYEIAQNYEGLSRLFPFAFAGQIEKIVSETARYSPILRFILEDHSCPKTDFTK